ncbi:MAG: flavin reductase family protein [Bacillota bacterium]
MYKEVKFSDLSKELLEQLQKGAFLTVKSASKVNTMTIAWGSIGFMWNKPIFMTMVRYSRFTYELIENSQDFTISLPLKGQLRKELGICGTKSGRELDKIDSCKLKLREGVSSATPILDDCDLHLECRIVYKQAMDELAVSPEIREACYPKGDYHILYYGEIVKAYIKS